MKLIKPVRVCREKRDVRINQLEFLILISGSGKGRSSKLISSIHSIVVGLCDTSEIQYVLVQLPNSDLLCICQEESVLFLWWWCLGCDNQHKCCLLHRQKRFFEFSTTLFIPWWQFERKAQEWHTSKGKS